MPDDKLLLRTCKKCGSSDVVKCGHIRGKQRFRCKNCGYTFVLGDERTTEQIAIKKAMLLILHVMAGATVTELGRLYNIDPSQIFRWVVKSGFQYPTQDIYGNISHINIDNLDNEINRSIEKFDQSKQVIIGKGELMPGYRAIMILQTPTCDKIKEKEMPSIQYRTKPYINR